MAKSREIEIDLDGNYDLASTFALLSMGGGDPCLRIDGPKRLRFALATPAGPAAVIAEHHGARLVVQTLGRGADWLAPHLRAILGVDFRPPALDGPPRLKRIAAEHSGMRVAKLPCVSLRLTQIILQQLVSFRDACYGWRRLVERYGAPAPDQPGLRFPPEPRVMAGLSSSEFIECGVLPRHGRTIREAMRRSARIEQAWAAGSPGDAVARTTELLGRLPGIGPWTTGFLRGAGLGDADAEILHDYGHAKHVGYFFSGDERADDAEMLRLLEPYRPHRFYVLTLIILGAAAPPRRGPKRRRLRDRFA